MKSGVGKRGLLALVACLGCASGAPRLAQMDADQLLEHGLARLEAHKWEESIRVFEQFIFQYPAHPRYQETRFRLGDAHFGKKEYLIAASEYGRLAEDFPASSWAEPARFKVCESYYRLSPRAELDQEYTGAAIDHCRSLLAYFPDSPLADSARALVTALEHKLARKELGVGEHYYKRGAYDSAIKYYEKVLAAYPASPAAPLALLGLYQSYDQIGWAEEAKETRDRLLREFPESEAAKRLSSGSATAPS